jgi:hypothetical protein
LLARRVPEEEAVQDVFYRRILVVDEQIERSLFHTTLSEHRTLNIYDKVTGVVAAMNDETVYPVDRILLNTLL